MNRLFRTISFRLTLLYAGLFLGSVLIIFGVIYWSIPRYITRQIDTVVDADLANLLETAKAQGLTGLAQAISLRIADPGNRTFLLLQNERGERLAGNLPAVPPDTGRITLDAYPPGKTHGEPHAIRGRAALLPDGTFLLVGVDANQIRELEELMIRAFGTAIVATLVLALAGGAIMSGELLRRVEAITRTSRAIMSGNLAKRVPMRGTDDEFDRLASSLNAMLDRIESLMEGMRQVSNDIAHDLRTPLTHLRQRLEKVRIKSRSATEYEAAIDRSIADTDAILHTFSALLRIAQIESQAQQVAFGEVDLTELLATVLEVYEPAAEERQQKMLSRIDPGLIVRGDRELLAQMIANLIENAIRHSPARTPIEVATERHGDRIRIIVADGGPGIPECERERVFQRFHRLEASRTTPGSGLGLSLVAAIATLHAVTIRLTDNGPGLRVTIGVPAVR